MKPQQLAVVIALLTAFSLVAAKMRPPKYGLDIAGGARVVLQADTSQLPKGQTWNADTRNAVLRTIERRVNANGVSEPVITPKGNDEFVVEIPSIRNSDEVLEQLQNTAQLQFFYSPDWQSGANRLGRFKLDSELGADGKREEYRVIDSTAGKTFRDQFHVNAALRGFLADADKPGANATAVPIPAPLGDLPAAAGRQTLRLTADDAKLLPGLADELTNFKAFLAGAQLELDGNDLQQPTPATSGFDSGGVSKAVVSLEFNDVGRDKFANFTRDHTNEILMIYLDGQILMAPNINEPILDGRAQISPFATLKDAKQLADYINSGALPVPLKIIQQTTEQPKLGQEAIQQGFTAGLIGLGLIVLFMIGYYLLPGAIACLALLLYTIFIYAIFVLIPVTFTLPGIAGFILSVGMAVDANILIFERTKEELRAGRALRPAIEHGFQRAFSAIFDSNVCTAVTSILLYYFGTGAVRGFALTLLIGVAVSMFTAITVTRSLLLLVIRNKSAQDLNAWGINRQWRPRINVVRSRKLWYALSLAVIVPTIVFAALGGFKPGIDFTGGTELTLHFANLVTSTQVESAVTHAGFADSAAQIAGGNTVFVRLPLVRGRGEVTSLQANSLVAELGKTFPGVTQEGFERIGSSISAELTRNAAFSILLSSLFIVFYLAFRFAVGGFANGLKYGVAAVVAMLHDVLVLVGVFCALGYFLNWKIDSLFVTAALTVIGFSVHDTIVIFDRIRENLRERSKDESFDDLVDASIRETFARSINTSATVVMTLLALLIFGGPVIRPLNAALLIGIISGTYSSIFNAAPLVVDWRRRFGGGAATPTRAPVVSTPARPVPAPTRPAPSVISRQDAPGVDGNNGDGDYDGTDAARPSTLPPGPRPRRRRM